MNRLFNETMGARPNRNMFDLSHDFAFSMDEGNLTPVLCMEVLPGDKFSIGSASLVRQQPLVAPVMHRTDQTIHYFFVPNRLVWSNWETFITNPDEGLVAPYILIDSNPVGSVADYMGIATGAGFADTEINAIPFAAYAKIWNEYYRDQNLQDPIEDELSDGAQETIDIASMAGGPPLKRAWMHDMFTSALPQPQKGPEVTLPLGDTAPITFLNGVAAAAVYEDDGSVPANNPLLVTGGAFTTADGDMTLDNSASLQVDLTGATAADISSIRRAFKLQEWLELNARGGTRYIEMIRAHFGVRSSDARLQRPEYLGGGKAPIATSEVLQMSESATTPQGTMAGHGISVGNSNRVTHYFEEHGYIIGVMNVQPTTSYAQGIPRHFINRRNPTDFYWNSFAHIGEQGIFTQELWAGAPKGEIFGYTPRYAEYKYHPSHIAGEFRTSLSFWTRARLFETKPLLNEQFIEADPSPRIYAVEDGEASDPILVHIFFDIKASRLMPVFGVPKIE